MNFTAAQIAHAARKARSTIVERAQREGWAFETALSDAKRRLTVYPLATLPVDIRRALGVVKAQPAAATVDRETIQRLHDRFLRASSNEKVDAVRRSAIVRECRDLIEAGAPIESAVVHVCRKYDLQRTTVYRWRAVCRNLEQGDWPVVLLHKPTSGGRARAMFDEEAWQLIKADYLQTTKRPLKSVYNDAAIICEREGWRLPDYRTVLRRIDELDPAIIVLAREGEAALERLYPPMERDRSHYAACEALCADGHKFDVMVARGGKEFRPIIVAWQDLRSDKILSYRIANSESSDLVRLSFLDAVERYSAPAEVFLDNGRGFTALMLSGGARNRFRFAAEPDEVVGLFKFCGVEPRFCRPYSGQSKPIERAWGDLINYIEKHPTCIGAYTGNDPKRKPERVRAVEWDVFCALVAQQIAAHNARTGRMGNDHNGQSFDQTFEQSFATIVRKRLTRHQLDLWRSQPEPVTVPSGPNVSRVVSAYGNKYWHEALNDHAGSKILLRLDPDNLHAGASAYTMGGDFIAELETTAAGGFGDREVARSHGQARNEFTRAKKKMLKAEQQMTLAELQRITAPAMPEQAVTQSGGKVVSGAFQPRTKTAEQKAMFDALAAEQADELAARRAAKAG